EAGQADRLKAAADQMLTDFGKHLDAVCWLWRGKIGTSVLPIPQREMLGRLLDHLGQVTRSDYIAPKIVRDTRAKIRSALSAANYSSFRQIIEGMESGLASTIRTTVDRLDSLGHVVRANLIKIIHQVHPELNVGRMMRVQIDPWKNDNVIYCIQRGYDRRREEIEHLTRIKIPENAKAIGEAAARGDLSENSEYKFALEERDLLQARLIKLQSEFSLAHVLAAHEIDASEVSIGTCIALAGANGDRREMTILGPFESDLERSIYNYRAPLCAKLRGLHVGDNVTLELGAGEQEYRIESITSALP
ncbi:MAG: GreA/GreB family elongation factor, partial [Phycisphaerae bacterium]|nr:GreA/GreB family elongation factor [Phycisphaerae bacterium]